jgi:HEAT repeat protein
MMDPRGVALALPLRTHPSQDVGRGVVSALLAQKDESAIAALIELTRDGNRDVRDWATFGLVAMIDVDTPPIRDALRARLTDEDGDTRHEALGGLARQKDADAIVMIGDWLMRGEISEPLMQAAAEAANPSLCEGLRRARKVSLSKLRASKSIWKTLAKRR